jgi:hypothetical protein
MVGGDDGHVSDNKPGKVRVTRVPIEGFSGWTGTLMCFPGSDVLVTGAPAQDLPTSVRPFFCGAADCPPRTFAEPFSRLAAPHARFTTRLNRALERVGLAPAGRAGTRLAAQLGFSAGRMTLSAPLQASPGLG